MERFFSFYRRVESELYIVSSDQRIEQSDIAIVFYWRGKRGCVWTLCRVHVLTLQK